MSEAKSSPLVASRKLEEEAENGVEGSGSDESYSTSSSLKDADDSSSEDSADKPENIKTRPKLRGKASPGTIKGGDGSGPRPKLRGKPTPDVVKAGDGSGPRPKLRGKPTPDVVKANDGTGPKGPKGPKEEKKDNK
ncbi:hypothetical protein SIIN_1320_T [Serendipita indica DSM 11827]|nr:hypothetical protein SIIN_1320_T [Serendipita indica DSM 11827]